MTQILNAAYIGNLGVITVGASGYDFTPETLEPIIQQAIDLVSLEIGTDITHLSGDAGEKSVSLSDTHITVVSLMAEILAINACLNRTQLPWPVDKADTMRESIGSGGEMRRQLERLLMKAGQASPAFVVYNEPVPDSEE